MKIFKINTKSKLGTTDPHLTLHDGGVVAQLAAKVLVVAGANRDEGAVGHLLEREHLKSGTKSYLFTLPFHPFPLLQNPCRFLF